MIADFPPAGVLLDEYDANKDGALEASELRRFAVELRRKSEG